LQSERREKDFLFRLPTLLKKRNRRLDWVRTIVILREASFFFFPLEILFPSFESVDPLWAISFLLLVDRRHLRCVLFSPPLLRSKSLEVLHYSFFCDACTSEVSVLSEMPAVPLLEKNLFPPDPSPRPSFLSRQLGFVFTRP